MSVRKAVENNLIQLPKEDTVTCDTCKCILGLHKKDAQEVEFTFFGTVTQAVKFPNRGYGSGSPTPLMDWISGWMTLI
jgi:hypothetical protein